MSLGSYLKKEEIKLNGIRRFLVDTCQPPWMVYVETLWVPLGHLVLGLLAFGLADVLRGYLRPKGIYKIKRTGRRRPKTRLGRIARGGIPEIGELIGKRLPFHERLSVRRISHAQKTLWIIDGFLQRILFYWLIYDLTTDFIFEWSSLILESEACKDQRLTGSALCDCSLAVYPAEIAANIPCNYLEKMWGTISSGGAYWKFQSVVGVSMVAATWKPYFFALPGSVLTGIDVWIADPANPDVPLGTVEQATAQADGTFSGIATANIRSGQNAAAFCRPHGRAAHMTEGHLAGWSYNT